jgi:small neutral amino acid transporter SnatA (MarC family)
MISEMLRSATFLLVLLNPFLMVIYLHDIVEKLDTKDFLVVLFRAAAISSAVFIVFGLLGDTIFSDVLQAKFASFRVFGGVVFLLIGIRFVFQGDAAIEGLRGEPGHVAGAIAMPVMIGPGTVGASMLAGGKLHPLAAAGSIVIAVVSCVVIILVLKSLHDFVRPRNEALIHRYVEITGRIAAMVVGTLSVEMIMQGLDGWFDGTGLFGG